MVKTSTFCRLKMPRTLNFVEPILIHGIFKNPEILVLEDTNAVISDFVVAQSNIYYVKTKNGVDARLYLLKK
jgi:hypothetical protein